ncbi:hypothetical protein K474DRAFT_1702598, partial [Panus rudis PR-1116 ss-1]
MGHKKKDFDNKTRIRRSRKRTPEPTTSSPLFAPLITLLYAYLAHALGNRERAEVCYVVAGRLADGDRGMREEEVEVEKMISSRDSLGLGGSGSGNGTGWSPSGGLEKKKENATSRKPHLYTNTKGKQKQTALDEHKHDIDVSLKSLEHFRQLIKSDNLKGTVFDFWAAWCAPCKAISPVYDAFSQRLPEVSKAAGIRTLPTFQAYKSGVKVHEISASTQPALE